MRLYTRPQQWRMHAYNEREPRDYLSLSLSLKMRKKEKRKKNGGEQPGVSWRFITATYIRGQKERVLKKIKRERGRKNSGARLYIYSRWRFYRDALSIRTHEDARGASSRMHRRTPFAMRVGKREESSGHSSKLPAETIHFSNSHNAFLCGVPTYLPTYIPICLWAPLFHGKLSPVPCCARSAQLGENYSCVCIYLMTSDGAWDREMVFRERAHLKEKRVLFFEVRRVVIS